MSLTYVTAFIELPGSSTNASTSANPADFLEKFLLVARTGVPIILYISRTYYNAFQGQLAALPNVRIGDIVELADTETWKMVSAVSTELTLPPVRSEAKDTLEYMVCQHAKAEFMARATSISNAHIYAWMDFRVAHVFKNVQASLAELTYQAKAHYRPTVNVFPGCWPAEITRSYLDAIHWRFCGGFWAMDRITLENFWQLVCRALPQFLHEHGRMVWEVNFWAYLEQHHDWHPQWYKADHDDSLIRLPTDIYYASAVTQIKPPKPIPIVCPGYQPMNMSYSEYKGVRVLNVRCVNYTLTPVGSYVINDPLGIIKTRNVLCVLDASMNIFMTTDVRTNLPLSPIEGAIEGLEDIRLFEWNGLLYYLATQRQWTGRNRMMMGLYGQDIRIGMVLEPPTDTVCEKNWIPCISDSAGVTLRFIYGWHPYSVGELVGNRLSIKTSVELPGLFRLFKGSTVPVSYEGRLWCLVHYTIDGSPRKYYHVVVCLDEGTLMPTHWSRPFYFERVGVEYCTGMTVRDGVMYCWVSRHDKDPCLIEVGLEGVGPLNSL